MLMSIDTLASVIHPEVFVVKRNVGTADRAIRFLLGLGLLSAIFLLEGSIRWVGLIGLVPLLTAIGGSCPLYSLLGLSTCLDARPKM